MTTRPRHPAGNLRLVGDPVAGAPTAPGGRLAEVVYLHRCYDPAGPHGRLRHRLARLGRLPADVRWWLADEVRWWYWEVGWCRPGGLVRRWLVQAARLATNLLGGPVKWLG
jgi:hypothetical protein